MILALERTDNVLTKDLFRKILYNNRCLIFLSISFKSVLSCNSYDGFSVLFVFLFLSAYLLR